MNSPKSLEESLEVAIERLRASNDAMEAYLAGDTSTATRVANAVASTLEDVTERAKKYWDKLEARNRHSVPPKP